MKTANITHIVRHKYSFLCLFEAFEEEEGVHNDVAYTQKQHREKQVEMDADTVPAKQLQAQCPTENETWEFRDHRELYL